MRTLRRARYRWKMGASDASRVGRDSGKFDAPKSDSFIVSASGNCVIGGVE